MKAKQQSEATMTTSMQIIQVKVKPNARCSHLTKLEDGTYLAEIKSPPVDGKANEELIRLVSKIFNCSRSKVSVKVGGAARLKLIAVAL
jgi:uncharacterized protein (TIGR00251 family)